MISLIILLFIFTENKHNYDIEPQNFKDVGVPYDISKFHYITIECCIPYQNYHL